MQSIDEWVTNLNLVINILKEKKDKKLLPIYLLIRKVGYFKIELAEEILNNCYSLIWSQDVNIKKKRLNRLDPVFITKYADINLKLIYLGSYIKIVKNEMTKSNKMLSIVRRTNYLTKKYLLGKYILYLNKWFVNYENSINTKR